MFSLASQLKGFQLALSTLVLVVFNIALKRLRNSPNLSTTRPFSWKKRASFWLSKEGSEYLENFQMVMSPTLKPNGITWN